MNDSKSNQVLVHVRIVEATNIESGDVVKRTSDPYIKLRVPGHKFKYQTRVIKDTLHPVWNDDFSFLLNSDLNDIMTLKLKDLDQFKDDFLGKTEIPFALLKQHGGVYQGWFDFTTAGGSDRNRGSVFVKMVRDDDHTLNKKDKALVAAFPHHRKSLIYERTKHLDSQPRKSKPVKLFVGTWNVGNKPPPADLSPWLPREGYDLYVIGAQECEYKDHKDHKTVRAHWQHRLMEHFGAGFKLVGTHYLWEMRLLVIARLNLVPFISDVHTHTEATGIGSVLGNKGGVVVAFNVRDTRLVFVNSHLAAHQHKTAKRNDNVAEIIGGVHVGYPGIDILHQFHHVFWLGDLNYRLDYGDQGDDKTPSKELFEKMVEKIKHREFAELFAADQLAREMKADNVFIGFTEGTYNFPPTFKVKRNAELEYDEERSPAWCDRILWRSMGGHRVVQESLGCALAITTSDHKPVHAGFTIDTFRLTPGFDDMLGACALHITELSASDLPKADLDGSADPYVVFLAPFLQGLKHRTHYKANDRNPVWKPAELPPVIPLTINRKERLRDSFIMVAVFDHDQTKDDLMANAVMSVAPFVENAGKDTPFVLKLFAKGLPAGELKGVANLAWVQNDFVPKLLPPMQK